MHLIGTILECILQRWTILLGPTALIYVALVHALRYRRCKSLQKRYSPAGREDFKNMTSEDAQAILKTLAELEFPKLYGFSMVVALFRVGRPRQEL